MPLYIRAGHSYISKTVRFYYYFFPPRGFTTLFLPLRVLTYGQLADHLKVGLSGELLKFLGRVFGVDHL